MTSKAETGLSLGWLEGLRQDIRDALRNSRRRPGLAIALIALTAVGIGAATAVFSVVDRVLFRDLPYAASSRLVSLGLRLEWLEYDFLTALSYLELRRDKGPLTAVTSWSGVSDCDVTGDQSVRLGCARVESTFLPVLGVVPALGRNFTQEEDQPNVPRVALISHAVWKSRFGGEAGVLGRSITVDERPVRIIGVLPRGFELPTLDPADLLVPQALPVKLTPGARPLRVYGRLREEVAVPQARAELTARARTLFTEIPPDLRQQVQFHVRTLHDLRTGDFRLASWTLLAAVLALLLVACANAAGLLIASRVARRQELAIRAALGAGTARLTRQALTEVVMLSLIGGLAGCLLAGGLLRAFIAIAPSGIPHLTSASIDGRVLMFAVAISIVCGVAFGVAPALSTPKAALLTGARATGPASLTGRRVLVAAQLAVSLVLVASAGVLLQSLWARQAVPLGMRTGEVVTAQLALGARYAQPAQRAAFYEQLEARLERLPGISAFALSDSLPPGGTPRSQPIFAPRVQGRPPFAPATPGIVVWRAVTPGYFRTLGIPILRGRAFTEADRHPAELSMIISDSYARRLFGGDDPLGQKMSRSPGDARNPAPLYTIVGVAADARNAGLTDHSDPEYYIVRRHGSTAFDDAPSASAVILRAKLRPAALETWLRTQLAALDRALPVQIRTFETHIGELAARPRFQAWLLALFAGVGLLLAAFGVYGLLSFLVAQREREFGVRLALGATPAAIVRMVLADALLWSTGGLLAGLAGAAAAVWSLRGMLFHVSPASPAAYGAAALVLVTIALVAALLPARRAARLAPAITLRQN